MSQVGTATSLEGLRKRQVALRSGLQARHTQLGYAYDWSYFTRWCDSHSLAALPATSDTVSLYVAYLIERGLKVTSAERQIAAIAHRHRREGHASPADAGVRELLDGARRLRSDAPRCMKPITLEQLEKVCAKLRHGDARALRDRAILLVGFASALRRSTLTALSIDDVEIEGGRLLIHVRREKTDQEGRGRYIGIPAGKNPETCPTRALSAWLDARGRKGAGALFTRIGTFERLHPDAIWRVVKRRLAEAGIDPRGYGSHSLRAGFVTAAAEANVSDALIQAHTGHRSVSVMRKYFRRTEVWRANAAGMIGM